MQWYKGGGQPGYELDLDYPYQADAPAARENPPPVRCGCMVTGRQCRVAARTWSDPPRCGDCSDPYTTSSGAVYCCCDCRECDWSGHWTQRHGLHPQVELKCDDAGGRALRSLSHQQLWLRGHPATSLARLSADKQHHLKEKSGWVKAEGFARPREPDKFHLVICRFIETCWQRDRRRAAGVVCSTQWQSPLMERPFDGSWALLKAWQRAELPARAPPMPPKIVLALAEHFLQEGRTGMALGIPHRRAATARLRAALVGRTLPQRHCEPWHRGIRRAAKGSGVRHP